jgi:hypothetical protein
MKGGAFNCPNCGAGVPREPFCVCCGDPIEGAHEGSTKRRGYAASPHERWFAPRLVSSIFPHLPRSHMRSFRIAVALAAAFVVVLCLLRFFPLALVAAAVSVPLLFLIYMWDLDLYEDEPLIVLVFTVAWGALAGAGLGIAARNVASQVSLVQGKPNTHDVVWLGVILPCAALALALAGPLLLLPYKKFNDCLDGVIFGSSCAATLLAAEAISNSANFLHLGFRAAGNEALWIARLLTLGVTVPVLAAGVVGATCGAFWLRFRSPDRDRRALGIFGSPFVAVLLAAAALVAAGLAPLYLGHWTTLAVTFVLSVAALVWLRWLTELGLREEAAEKPIGPPVTCPSCHQETAVHTFCGHCGINLRALPKEGAQGKLRPGVKLAVFGGLAAAAVGIAAIVIAISRPAPPKPACQPGVPCAAPPTSPVAFPHAVAGVFTDGTPWTSDLGPGIHYPKFWHLIRSDKRTLVLQATGKTEFVVAMFLVEPSSRTPAQALSDMLAGDKKTASFLGVSGDGSAKDVILSPELGYVHGVAGVYRATVDQPPSPSEQVEIALEAARHGGATVVVQAITNQSQQGSSASSPYPDFQVVDSLLSTFSWGAPPT